jgi:magnesium-transporting ATPase (P-type)
MGKKKDIGMDNPQLTEQSPWHTMTVEETTKQMGLPADLVKNGLSSDEAASRLEKYGPNKMTEKEKVTIWQRIWHQINNVLVYVLLTVAVVSLVQATALPSDDPQQQFSSWFQVALILGVITLNTWIGIYQEGNAEKAADALKNMLSTDARVVRGGKEVMIPAGDIVPGDVCILELGDKIPADLRMFNVTNLATGEAALTGESVPIDKVTDALEPPPGLDAEQVPLGDRKNMAYSATLVAQGSGTGIAIATGDFTQIGTINRLVNNTETVKTDVLKQIDQVSKWLFVAICTMCLATFLVAFFYSKFEAMDSVIIALTCAVAMVPEGLEAIVTLTYSYAVKVMASQNAIVRALPAVETLGSVTVICSDKTGTLTQNIMSLTAFVTSNARYKNNVDANDRVPVNFVRDDTYLAERAQHEMKKSGEEILAAGPNNPMGRRGHNPSNHFTVDSLHTSENPEDAAKPAHPDDNFPFANGESPTKEWIQSALSCGVLCSKCVLGEGGGRAGEIGNPTELSILRASYFAGIDIEELKNDCPIVAEVPFSSEYKFMATIHEPAASDNAPAGKYIAYIKGAPDRMVKQCKYQAKGGVGGDDNLDEIDEQYWIEQIAILSSHGLRVLGLCRAFVDKDSVKTGEQLGPEFVTGRPEGKWLTMVGLCAIMDPPRPECVQAIKEAHGAGVRVAMITGDHKDTATAIGHMLGIVDEKFSEAVTGPELDAMSDDEIRKCVLTHNVFARASPQNKIRIVKALQAEGQVASMTGDGVNDAPALKAANMGVAMGKEGTDVAREASEMILADDNFATIVYAVKQGRVVWDNLRKVLMVNTPINNSQGLSVLVGLLARLPSTPLTTIQILYSNFICAVTLGFVTAIEPAEDGIMDNPPRRVGKRLIGRFLFLRIILGTCVLTGCVVGAACIVNAVYAGTFYPNDADEDKKETLYKIRATAFNVLDFGAMAVMMSARFSYNSSVSIKVFKGNPAAVWSCIIVAVLQVACTYIPGLNTFVFGMKGLDGLGWGLTAASMVIVFVIMEVEKAIRRRLKAKGSDTDDREDQGFFEASVPTAGPDAMKMPKGASKLNLMEVTH